jgi:succinate dehydrogenase flavin-adding protein (antitoxin of CptAB toxin-antitoxin module)
MKVEEIAEAIAMLPPDQLARFRRWFAAFAQDLVQYCMAHSEASVMDAAKSVFNVNK